MAKHSHWKELWWAILQAFGRECYNTWKSEVISAGAGGIAGAVVDYFRSHGRSSFSDALFNGILGAAVVFCLFAVVNLARSIWLEHKSQSAGTTWQGIGGLIVVVVLIVAFGLALAFTYGDARSTIVLSAPANVADMKALEDCRTLNTALAKPEDENSLRRRTVRLANKIDDWVKERRERHPPFPHPQTPPTTKDKETIDAAARYDSDTADQFLHRFRDEWVAIVHEYAARGVRTGTLENDADQIHPAQYTMFEFALEDSGNYTTATSRFRELAYHVNAHDARVDIILDH